MLGHGVWLRYLSSASVPLSRSLPKAATTATFPHRASRFHIVAASPAEHDRQAVRPRLLSAFFRRLAIRGAGFVRKIDVLASGLHRSQLALMCRDPIDPNSALPCTFLKLARLERVFDRRRRNEGREPLESVLSRRGVNNIIARQVLSAVTAQGDKFLRCQKTS
jgi:hypothetical protein